jgi:hypothetical protein
VRKVPPGGLFVVMLKQHRKNVGPEHMPNCKDSVISLPPVARSRQVCINWVVEALLVAIYLTEKKNVYIHIRLTWSPEANLPPRACPAKPSAVLTQLNLQPSLHS